MKKLIFLLSIVFITAGLLANAVQMAPRINSSPNPDRPQRDIFYTENFESGATGWTHWDGAVSPNMWHIYNNGDAQGNVWWMGDPALASGSNIGGYHDHQYLVLDTPVIAVATGSSTLTFKMRMNMEEPGTSGDFNGWDSFNIRVSTNAGISWTVIPTTLITPGYDFTSSYAFGSEHGETPPVPAWGGIHEPWQTVTVDLSGYAGGNVKIRFAFASDPAYSTVDQLDMYGVMVDDISLGTYTNNGVNDGQMTWSSLVPTAGDFWHLAVDASAPSPTHIMSSKNSEGTYVNYMLNYLMSPSITLPADATQIVADFQMRGTYYDPGVFPDVDYFGWEISPDNGFTWRYMSNPYADPEGMNYVYSGAPANWASMITSYTLDGDITGFAGQTVKFRWYFQSNGTTPQGTPLEIDDFQIFSVTAAPAPVNLVYPLNNQTNLPATGFNLDWAPSALGAFPDKYTVCVDAVLENLEEATLNPTYTFEIIPVLVGDEWLLYSYCHTSDLGLPLAAGQTWYWMVVAGITGQPDAYSEIFRFDIGTLVVINTFPWNEGFENATFPPANWSIVNLDGGGTTWVENTTATYVHSGAKSAKHAYSAATPDQDGWLVTPAISLPMLGTFKLSWWNYNQYPTYMVYNGVKVNSVPDPSAPGWVPLWTQTAPAAAWSNVVIDITDYTGQIVYFAFNYQGYDAENWFVDDISIYELTTDEIPPTITHLPVLNTPREDINYLVYADIVDDLTWNNPIGGANLYYSIDGGTTYSAAIPMTLDVAPSYYAYIPAQPLGTNVIYYIEAWDSELNYAESDEYGFGVFDPTWIWYDTGAGSPTWFGATTQFSPFVAFENPFYGTDNAVQLFATDGVGYDNVSPYEGFNADLYVYGWDGVSDLTFANLVTIVGPVSVFFGDGTYEVFDLTAYDLQIDYPYFFVRYNIPLGNAYYIDSTYDYGMTFVLINNTIYTLTNPGSWLVGVNVGTGDALGLEAPVAVIYLDNGSVALSWDSIAGAGSYKVYASNDPYAADPWTVLTTTANLSYTYAGTENYKFFKVTANSDAPPAGRYLTSVTNQSRMTAPVISAPLNSIPMTDIKVRELPRRVK